MIFIILLFQLLTLNPSIVVRGDVVSVRTEQDGDWHINIKLDKQYEHFLNKMNIKNQHGYLVIEVVPRDQDSVMRPKVGLHVKVEGKFVKDLHHGWNEIHPATRIIYAR